ncbi:MULTISPECIES: hypothetical protein [unclassified Streptomyces]|uniref:hypothetical protein n=1 Tax=Streptomyces sp. NPDC127532 TaxID=3345399 RepID=UPI00362B0040
MKPDVERELIPRDDALHLIGALNVMKDKAHNAAHQWKLLDENGHVPASPSYTVLLQHATDAQDLARDVLRLTADFARSPHHTTRDGSTVLKKLAWAATASSHAPPRFAETAEYALSLPRSTNPADLQFLTATWSGTTPQAAPISDAPRKPSGTRPKNSTTTSASNASSRNSPVRKVRRHLRPPDRAVAPANRAPDPPTSPRNALKRPPHFSDADWAEYQQCQAEHDDLMEQVADRESQLERELIPAYDEYQLDFSLVPTPDADPARRNPPPSRSPASHRRSRGR